jgi:hypothetical protein
MQRVIGDPRGMEEGVGSPGALSDVVDGASGYFEKIMAAAVESETKRYRAAYARWLSKKRVELGVVVRSRARRVAAASSSCRW